MDNDENKIKSNKRYWKNYFIYPRFQLSLIAFNFMLLFAALGIIFYQVKSSFKVLTAYSQALHYELREDYLITLNIQTELVFEVILIAGTLFAILSIFFNLLFSHKSSGAIYRLRKYFLEMSEQGVKSDLTFREGDMHDNLPETINKALSKVKSDSNTKDK